MLEETVGSDGKINGGAARATVRVGAEVQGMLDQSRADQVETTNLKTHEDEIYSAGESVAEVLTDAFLRHNGVDPNSDFAQDLRESMLLGYAVGNDRENEQGHDPETG